MTLATSWRSRASLGIHQHLGGLACSICMMRPIDSEAFLVSRPACTSSATTANPRQLAAAPLDGRVQRQQVGLVGDELINPTALLISNCARSVA